MVPVVKPRLLTLPRVQVKIRWIVIAEAGNLRLDKPFLLRRLDESVAFAVGQKTGDNYDIITVRRKVPF
ncbi:hypothetical protein ATCV1_z751L [Acanthocystis turfacea chlorella virus 1]|uniref:Uncharacterized protein z751L n=1 Tax=Chlorovirus heliozoae TaxID=322019 RepID=A7KA11_9PHYC|nr:hypothetical protein ATCV1_z751L [Acanthocystis turfacea chlorella virus 1]ABT16885.1 hypothetical protein ATCV1_z751L [Acanthocystis turfacea chlorella virus 1]